MHLTAPYRTMARACRVLALGALALAVTGCAATKAYRIESLFGKSVKGTYFLERTFGQLYRDGTAWRLSPGIVIWTSADADRLKVPVAGVLEYCPAEVAARCSTTRGILRFTPKLPDDPEFLPDVGVVPQFIELAYMDPGEVKKAVAALNDSATANVVAGNEIGSPEQHVGSCPPGIPVSACARRVEITMVDDEGNYLDPLHFVPSRNGGPVLAPLVDKDRPRVTSTDIHLFPDGSHLPADELPRSGGVITVKGDVDVVALVKDLGPSACDAAGNCTTPLADQVPLALKSLSYQLLETTGQPVPGSERKVNLYCLPRSFHKDEGSSEDDTDHDELYHPAYLPAVSTDGLPYILTNLNDWAVAHCPAPPIEPAQSSGRLCFDHLGNGSTYLLRVAATDHADQPPSPPPAEVKVHVAIDHNIRKEIHSLKPEEIEAFRAGVKLMKEWSVIDPTDPRGWEYQANMHGYPGPGPAPKCAPPEVDAQEAWATCQHGEFFFLPWHRMYLYYFERILRSAVREALGKPDYPFALPYWDYENPSYHDLPEPFRLPANSDNALYVQEREGKCNQGEECVSASDASAKEALRLEPFCNCPSNGPCDGCQAGGDPDETFGGQFISGPDHTADPFHRGGASGRLENEPHNVIHGAIGGDEGWMSFPECAARDPIFWLHHANIDRLWQVWLNQGGDRANPLGSTIWKSKKFTFFDENKNPIELSSCQILHMIALQLPDPYQYQYPCLPVENVKLCPEKAERPGAPAPRQAAPAPTSETRSLAATAPTTVALGNEPKRVPIPLAPGTSQLILDAVAAAETQSLRVVIEGIELVHRGAFYQVYLNLPEGQVPDPDSIYFLGNLAVFGDLHEGGPTGRRGFDIADTVRALAKRKAWTGQLDLTFVRGNPQTAPKDRPNVETPRTYLRLQRIQVIHRVQKSPLPV